MVDAVSRALDRLSEGCKKLDPQGTSDLNTLTDDVQFRREDLRYRPKDIHHR
jgi:hypothetical protein